MEVSRKAPDATYPVETLRSRSGKPDAWFGFWWGEHQVSGALHSQTIDHADVDKWLKACGYKRIRTDVRPA